MDENDTITQTYATLLGTVAAVVTSGVNTLEVAACLSQLGLSLYKDSLSPEDYEVMCNEIINRRHLVTGFSDSCWAVDESNKVLH